MTAREILDQLIDRLRAIPKCDLHDPCECAGDCECGYDGVECATCGPLEEALLEAENELDRGRLITRDVIDTEVRP